MVLVEATLQHRERVFVEAGEELGVGAGDAIGRFEQAFAGGVLADGGDNLAHGVGDALLVDG